MILIEITRVQATDKPGMYMCLCTVQHAGEEEYEYNMHFGYDPDDPYSGAFGQSVGQWLIDHEGEYVIEPLEGE